MNTENNHLYNARVSEVLQTLIQNLPQDEISIRYLHDQLSRRVYGSLLLIFALPNLIPLPLPGLSTVTGFPLLILSIQLMLGKKTPWFPKTVLNQTIKKEHLEKIHTKIRPYLLKLERFVIPRYFWLTQPPADRMIACICVFLSFLMLLPIIFGNLLPALAICFFAIAILERDGVFVLIGLACTIVSLFVIGFFLSALLAAGLHLIGYY
jgi:hypothetical protein